MSLLLRHSLLQSTRGNNFFLPIAKPLPPYRRSTPPHQYLAAGTCIQCSQQFQSTNQLTKHGREVSHKPFGCSCGATFTRRDTLNRHITTQSDSAPQHTCDYCYECQGSNGFRRLDDLYQHLKVYHKINTTDVLSEHRASEGSALNYGGRPKRGGDPAVLQAQIQVPPFPCAAIGCPKGGANDYLRLVDLLEHQNMMHPFISFGAGMPDFGPMQQQQQQQAPVEMQPTRLDGNFNFGF